MEESSSARIYLLMINLSKHIIWLVSESNIWIAITKVKMVIQRYLLDYCYRNIVISLYCDNLLIIDSFFFVCDFDVGPRIPLLSPGLLGTY